MHGVKCRVDMWSDVRVHDNVGSTLAQLSPSHNDVHKNDVVILCARERATCTCPHKRGSEQKEMECDSRSTVCGSSIVTNRQVVVHLCSRLVSTLGIAASVWSKSSWHKQ